MRTLDSTATAVADRFVAALENGDETELARLYHPGLRFTIRTSGAAFDRDAALRNARTMLRLLSDVEVEVVDRQLTESGFLSQQVLRATLADGARIEVPMCMVVELCDGRIGRIDEYFDAAAVGPLAAVLHAG